MGELKHNQRITFKGLVYRYNKRDAELVLITKKASVLMPDRLRRLRDDSWVAHPLSATSPEELLERHLQARIAMHVGNLAEFKELVTNTTKLIKKLKSGDLT